MMERGDLDPLDDPAMALMLRRYAAQEAQAGTPASLTPARRAALRDQLDAIDAEYARGRPRAVPRWRAGVMAAAVAAACLLAAMLVLHSLAPPLPQVEATVAQAEPVRGGPPSRAFRVEVAVGEPGFVRIYAYTDGGRRHALTLRDDQTIARLARRTRFGEFEVPGAWRLLVAFAPDRPTLIGLDQRTPASLQGATPAERARELGRVLADLRGQGIAALELTMP